MLLMFGSQNRFAPSRGIASKASMQRETWHKPSVGSALREQDSNLRPIG